MNKLCRFLCASVVLFCSQPSFAEQSQDFANLQVHYIALPSTFLQASTAQNYGFKRSKYTGLINISVLDKNLEKQSVSVTLSGTGKNLLGQISTLKFKKVSEGDAIYYLATYPFSNEEIVNFEIKITSKNKTNTLKFQHKFYVD